jgi:hypothetical protein
MAGEVSARIARRLLALATAAMPPSRRDWGSAMSAELAVMGAVLAPLGAIVAQEADLAWRRTHVPQALTARRFRNHCSKRGCRVWDFP